MSFKTLQNFSHINNKHLSLDLYEVWLTLHGYLWFHTIAIPTNIGWVHQASITIHNYPLILGFLGYPVEESYANIIGSPSYNIIRSLAQRRKVYAFPAQVINFLNRKVQFSSIGEGHVGIRGKTRLTYPERAFNTVLLPGSKLKTYLLVSSDFNFPEYIRIGSRRAGILNANYIKLEYSIGEHLEITHPANSFDSSLNNEGVIILWHKGGNIVTMTVAPKVLVAKKEGRDGVIEKTILAYPNNILGE
ncbi:MAG: hypothetical protein LRS41_05335 [Caldisphaeraceae archaeon]|nr:hypothetical protein [Caldisphaeraceae archaeon]